MLTASVSKGQTCTHYHNYNNNDCGNDENIGHNGHFNDDFDEIDDDDCVCCQRGQSCPR